jgi:hypothetical protein
MFRNTLTSLAWVVVFSIAGVGVMHSCALLDTTPTTPEQTAIVVSFEEEAAAIASEREAAEASGDAAALAGLMAREEDLTRRWAAYDANIVREKVGPIGQVLGSIHPALGALSIFGVNAAAALATRRGRKHAWNAVRNFSPGSTATGDPWKPAEGVKDLGRMLGWLHSTEASKAAAEAKLPTPPPAPA